MTQECIKPVFVRVLKNLLSEKNHGFLLGFVLFYQQLKQKSPVMRLMIEGYLPHHQIDV